MAKEDTLQLPAASFKGLQLRPSILNRDFNSAQICSNFEKLKSGKGTIRKATQCEYASLAATNTPTGTFGICLYPFTYTYFDIDDTSQNEEQLWLLYKIKTNGTVQSVQFYTVTESTISFTYTGSGVGTISMVPATVFSGGLLGYSKYWVLTVKEDGVVVYTANYHTAESLTASSIDFSGVNALANWTVTDAGSGRGHIDSIAPFDETTFTATPTVFTYTEYASITDTGLLIDFTDANFILPSALNYSNVIYFALGTYEYKYDGQAFYRSGLPQASINAIADSASGTAFALGQTFIYKTIFSRLDAKNNIIDGTDSDDTLTVATHVMVATKNIDLTVNTLDSTNYSTYNIHGAKVNGLQAGVTVITVDAAHNMVIGDVAYFYNSATSAYVTRNVTAVAATTITIDGAVVTVADNIFISNNVRIQIWRTKNGDTDFYLVEEIPNVFNATTFVYTDSKADTALTEPFVEQIRKNDLPPKCSFLALHQGLKVSGGDPDNPNRAMWTTPDNPEGYPLASNLTDMKGGGVGAMTALGAVSDDQFVLFKEQGHIILQGTLDDLNFETKDRTNTGIGCTSHRSLAHVGEGDALVGVSRKGVFIFNNGVPSLAIGDAIRPIIDKKQTPQVNDVEIAYNTTALPGLNAPDEITLKRAVAINDNINSKYHLFLPAELGIPGFFKAPMYYVSKYLVFDYAAEIPFWTEYSFYDRYRPEQTLVVHRNVNVAGGFTIYKNKLWFGSSDPYVSVLLGGSLASIFSFKNDEDIYDYCEAGYPVYLDIQYTPFAREINAVTGFFKALKVTLFNFLDDALADLRSTLGLNRTFTFRLKTVKDGKNYPTPAYTTNAAKTFYSENGTTAVPTKCVTDKCRTFQIQLTTEDAAAEDYEQIVFDNLELVYSIPYDRRSKDPKAG